jgi:cytochrome bd ubiquinol oxidase subunit I
VVSGIVMEFQFGTNWSGFTQALGGVLGPLFTYEVMTAFFIEAGFLGVMLFGWNRVGPKLHYLATLLVTLGTTLSAYWIMSANSWMQHPVGYQKANNVFHVLNWTEIIFNPANFPRYIHMLLASYISASFVICSVCALYLLRKQHLAFSKKCFSFCWGTLLIMVPLQIYFGDLTGLEVFNNQPIKTAAIEGVWNTVEGAPLLLFAIPDQKQQTNHWALSIPHFASYLNTHRWNGTLIGLKTVPIAEQPPVLPVFYSFRIMVAIGFSMLFLAVIAWFLKLKMRLFHTRWFLKISVLTAPIGFIALWCGWITAEMGRQPWVVYHLLKTADAFSRVSLHDVMVSFILIVLVYGVIFGGFYFYFLHKTLSKGPMEIKELEEGHQPFQYMPSSYPKEP